MGDLTVNFSMAEFVCNCGCGLNRVDHGLADRLQIARNIYRHPIVITSGTRCRPHNEQCGGSKESAHIYGKAADLRCESSAQRYDLLMALLTAGFERVGIGKEYIHVDIDYTKSQNVCWLYP